MKPIEEQNHYEILELPSNARLEDIQRAYPLVRAAYEDESLAIYSVFGRDESEMIRQRVDAAYRVLIDGEARRRYDEQIGLAPGVYTAQETAVAVDSEPSEPVVGIARALREIDEDEGSGDWDGAKLRRARIHRGIELERISEITRINLTYLRAIEENAYRELPAPVYTRGFVTAYARTIAVDPHRVAESYMTKFEEVRSDRRRKRLLSSRR